MRYGSVCSGISAASVAWRPLGWRAAWFAEIEPFPCAVLAHHYPDVPNLGDMTKIARAVLAGTVEAPDVLEGGTPCQSYSIAGLRASLDDARGNLTLKFVELADAIDHVRISAGRHPCVITWENVPGVLSTKDNAFGCFLAGLAGEDVPLVAPGGKWANSGCVYGPKRAIAWRTLDAQYFGVAQRRRRVFVVASARKDFDPATVLFEWDGVRRDSPPSREARQDVAGTLAASLGGADENDAADGRLVASTGDVSHCLNAGGVGEITGTLRSMGHKDSHQNGGGHLAVCVPSTFAIQAGALRTNPNSGPDGIGVQSGIAYTMEARAEVQAVCVTGDVTHTLKAEGFDASEDGTGRGQPIVAVFDTQQITSFHNRSTVQDGAPAPTLSKVSRMHAIDAMAVRRLLPVECERLMGFPDFYTSIPTWKGWRKMDASETPESCEAEGLEVRQNKRTGRWSVRDVDGPRYKALGNSMCVNVMVWLGKRIQLADPIHAACETIEQ